jgi:hypothetical protein
MASKAKTIGSTVSTEPGTAVEERERLLHSTGEQQIRDRAYEILSAAQGTTREDRFDNRTVLAWFDLFDRSGIKNTRRRDTASGTQCQEETSHVIQHIDLADPQSSGSLR